MKNRKLSVKISIGWYIDPVNSSRLGSEMSHDEQIVIETLGIESVFSCDFLCIPDKFGLKY